MTVTNDHLEVSVTVSPDPGTTPAGLPRGVALSPSRASDFLSCPLLFRFRAIDKFPERPGAAAARGILVHSVLESLFDLPAAERTLAAAANLLLPSWNELVEGQPSLTYAVDSDAEFVPIGDGPPPTLSGAQVAKWISAAEPLLKTYFKLEDPTRLEPRARELRLEVELADGTPLRGIVDRIDEAPGNLVRVVDYKTGRSPGPAFEQKALFQMRFYALMIHRIEGVLPKRLQLIYLGNGDVIRYDPTLEELNSFSQKLSSLWEAITTIAETGDWQPKESRMCDWCDHHARCPAKGGVLPDMPVDIALTTKPSSL